MVYDGPLASVTTMDSLGAVWNNEHWPLFCRLKFWICTPRYKVHWTVNINLIFLLFLWLCVFYGHTTAFVIFFYMVFFLRLLSYCSLVLWNRLLQCFIYTHFKISHICHFSACVWINKRASAASFCCCDFSYFLYCKWHTKRYAQPHNIYVQHIYAIIRIVVFNVVHFQLPLFSFTVHAGDMLCYRSISHLLTICV